METLLVFVPCALYNDEPGILYGIVQETKEERVKSYYILGKSEALNLTRSKCSIIGYYYKERYPGNFSLRHKSDWLILGLHECEFILHEVSSGGEVIGIGKQYQVVCIIYNHNDFVESEFLLDGSEFNSSAYGDHFKTLANTLNREIHFHDPGLYAIKSSVLTDVTLKLTNLLLLVMNVLLNCIDIIHPVLKFSTLGLHLQVFLKSVVWVLQSCTEKKKLSIKVANYVVATAVDILCGFIVLYWIIAITSSPTQLLLDSGEEVVRTLRELLHWLMGIPAGLKLNYAFNNMLGRFFLYHINLWWTFLVVAKPLLEASFYIFLCLGRLGLTFQVSVLADLLALVSFHVYCIYVYAARLYNLQVSGLVALWRLFLGRKHNPLRGRVDSCKYTPDQLFVGTLAFTILLFLLPTTFMYYIVFTTLRLVVVGLGGLLTRIRYILQCLPLYVSLLWFLQSTSISSTVHLTVRFREKGSPLNLSVRPVAGSWWKTVKYCMPEPVQPPPIVEWGSLIGNLVSGRLIYPV